jgi:hypothetical protein
MQLEYHPVSERAARPLQGFPTAYRRILRMKWHVSDMSARARQTGPSGRGV